MNRFKVGEKVYIFVEVLDDIGQRVPGLTNIQVRILKPDGSVISGLVMTEVPFEPGIYYLESNDTALEGYYFYVINEMNFGETVGYFLIKDFIPGLNKVIVRTVFEDDNSIITGALVAVYVEQNRILSIGKTDLNGEVIFYLPIGIFTLRGYHEEAFFQDMEINVSSDMIVEFKGHRISIEEPTDARLMRVFGYIRDLDLDLKHIKDIRLTFRLGKAPSWVDKVLLSIFPVKAIIDLNTGFFYADLVRGVEVIVICQEAHLFKRLTLPTDKDKIELRLLL